MKFTKDGRNWEMPDAFYRVSLKLIIKDENDKLLVIQDGKTSCWELPGGGLDHGETILQALEREVQEELGVKLMSFSSEPIIKIGQHPDGYTTLKIYYHGELSSTDFITEDNFTFSWVNADEFSILKMQGDESPIQENPDKIWH